ncbi:hypothetical protein Lesp02_15980 [Lentzea sp. NBRC 105346]|uniref:DUF6817 domain-containing protein n=1 Tax=Lentzea sp. NBRC 105346 TaxID=3032205 RepID=UPI0024A1FBEF|nr:hypothetical protein [Lentzea sp. NBRC 105346]GLZ29408.1 hypothetical protein Lesp02_15980 [Lentzea sp. NBRC 105346]
MTPETWLREHGAETIDHPGGTLYAHLLRIRDRLKALGLAEHVQLAGLVHAVYGTDGFPLALADHTNRDEIRDLVGAEAEDLVYRYGACDRNATWPHLPGYTDRFTQNTEQLDAASTRDLVDLSIVNELDVYEQSAEIAEKYGDYFREQFAKWAPLASPAVIAEADQVLQNTT